MPVEGSHPRSVTLVKRPTQSTFGFTLRHVIVYPPVAVAEDMNCVPTSIVFVHNVHKGGAGKDGGLREADRIMSINGESVTNCQYEHVVDRIQCSGDTLSLVVLASMGPCRERTPDSSGSVVDSCSLSSQSDRIEALMTEMRPPPTQMPYALRGAYSYDCIPSGARGPPPPYRPRPPSYKPPQGRHNVRPTLIVQFQDNPVQRLHSLPPPPVPRAGAPLRHGRSVDSIAGEVFCKRGSLATLPEIKENLQIDLDCSSPSSSIASRPSLSPFKSGKTPHVPKSFSFESGLQKSEFRSNSVQGCRGESSRLQHLQKVSKLAKKFEEGSVDLVGPLKLYHAQTYKRELQRIASTNEASGVKRVRQTAHALESSTSSCGSSVASNHGDKRIPVSNYEQLVLEQLASRTRSSTDLSCSPRPPPCAMTTTKTARDAPAMTAHDSNKRGKHRISRFMNLFSSPSADQLCSPSAESSAAPRTVSSHDMVVCPLHCISCAGIVRQGPVMHCCRGPGPSDAPSEWRKCWAVVHEDSHLYVCLQRPHKTIVDNERVLQVPAESTVVDLSGSIVDIAYDAVPAGRAHTVRVVASEETEHLVQSDSQEIMLQWIEALQTAAHRNDSQSMALIIKRYETKQKESKSPAQNKPRKLPLRIGATASAPVTDSPCASHPPAETSRSSPPTLDAIQKTIKGDHTPNRARRWKKVAKSGSCPQSTTKALPAFGHNLEDCITSSEDDFVPLLVRLCVKVVEAHGLDNVGVYRIPGNTAAVNALSASLDKGFDHVDFSDPRWKDVNVVSSLLKAFFRRLPEPMLTDKLYPMFIDANRQENHAKRMHKLRHLVHKLPKHNYECLKYLTSHLNRVVINAGVNKMEARNLALMFGPSIVRPSGDNMSAMVSHMSDQCKIVESLIMYADWLFDLDKERPTPSLITSDHPSDQMTSSFSDMSDLLRRVHKTEEDLEKTKDNIVRSILNVRRGSRKGHSNARVENTYPTRDSSAHTRSPRKRYSRPAKSHSDKPLLVERVFNGDYEERDIDAEIESRLKAQPPVETPEEHKDQSLEQMRKHREENIYTARRIFIAGPQAGPSTPSIDPMEPSHSPDPGSSMHSVNLNALDTTDILSPETRDKIRKLKEQGKLAHCNTLEYVSSDDVCWSAPAHSRPARSRATLDTTSITSDYSTTSSPSRVTSVESTESVSTPTSLVPSSLLYDRKRLRHVQPAESPWNSARRVPDESPRPGKERAWYEEEDKGPESLESNVPEKSNGMTPQVPQESPVTADARPVSRISQKIKFRSKSASADKRKDIRRHTLSDMEQNTVRSVLGQNTAHSKWTKSSRLKAWFKESFRKSSPDLSSLTVQ